MKTYTGIELLQAIKDGKIKSGTNIEVHDLSVLDKLVTTIHINSDRGLVWKTGEFDTSFLLNDYYYFKITDIDIQSIEHNELDILQEILGKCDLWKGNEDYILKVINENNNRLVDAILKVSKENETLTNAIKQLDRQINNN